MKPALYRLFYPRITVRGFFKSSVFFPEMLLFRLTPRAVAPPVACACPSSHRRIACVKLTRQATPEY